MNKLDCPHCGKRAITVARKMILGPSVPASCRECRKKVGVPYSSLLAAVPFLVAFLLAPVVQPFALKAALWLAGFTAMTVLHLRWVPLERR